MSGMTHFGTSEAKVDWLGFVLDFDALASNNVGLTGALIFAPGELVVVSAATGFDGLVLRRAPVVNAESRYRYSF